MSKKQKEDVTLEALVEELEELLNEIMKEQKLVKTSIEEKHKTNMKKFSKIIQYMEINDMTNQIFEKRISSIEALLYEVFKS